MAKRNVRVFNTTHLVEPPTGHMLDFNEKMFAPGRQPIVVEIDGNTLPEVLENWRAKGHIRVVDNDSGESVGVESFAQPVLTAGSKVQEVSAEALDDMDDDIGFDPTDAREALLPGAHAPNTRQTSDKPRAKVTLGSESEDNDNATMSPIPGDRPRSIDNSDAFTIRAPRSSEVGSVIGR